MAGLLLSPRLAKPASGSPRLSRRPCYSQLVLYGKREGERKQKQESQNQNPPPPPPNKKGHKANILGRHRLDEYSGCRLLLLVEGQQCFERTGLMCCICFYTGALTWSSKFSFPAPCVRKLHREPDAAASSSKCTWSSYRIRIGCRSYSERTQKCNPNSSKAGVVSM